MFGATAHNDRFTAPFGVVKLLDTGKKRIEIQKPDCGAVPHTKEPRHKGVNIDALDLRSLMGVIRTTVCMFAFLHRGSIPKKWDVRCVNMLAFRGESDKIWDCLRLS